MAGNNMDGWWWVRPCFFTFLFDFAAGFKPVVW
jgi:hypothetical protein